MHRAPVRADASHASTSVAHPRARSRGRAVARVARAAFVPLDTDTLGQHRAHLSLVSRPRGRARTRRTDGASRRPRAPLASASAGAEATETRPERPDTIAPLAEALYPRALDGVPTFFGRMNPLTATLLFYTGAVLRESREAPIIGAQWMLLVALPTFGALYAARRWWYENKTAARWEGRFRPFGFNRACRSAWLDFHLGYMLLVPAGAYGGEGSSWWLLTAPTVMALRWLGARKGKFFRTARRVSVVVFGVAGLATLLMSASTTLVKALAALRGGGAVGLVLGPLAIATSYVFYIAPACLLPNAILRAWTNTLDDAGDENAVQKPSEADASKTPEELAKEKRKKRVGLIVGFIAFGATLATGSDIPLLILFAFQLLKVDPEDFMNAVINKGSPERAEMEQAIADKFAKLLPGAKKNGAAGESREKPPTETNQKEGDASA